MTEGENRKEEFLRRAREVAKIRTEWADLNAEYAAGDVGVLDMIDRTLEIMDRHSVWSGPQEPPPTSRVDPEGVEAILSMQERWLREAGIAIPQVPFRDDKITRPGS